MFRAFFNHRDVCRGGVYPSRSRGSVLPYGYCPFVAELCCRKQVQTTGGMARLLRRA